MSYESYEDVQFHEWFFIGSGEPIDANFKTMAISGEIEVAKIAYETTILDFRDSVVLVAAHAKNVLICGN